MRRCAWLLLYLCCSLNAQAADRVRTWTNLQGRTMQAEFVREANGDAVFLKDGKLVTIPLDQLSEDDRKVIRELEAAPAAAESAPRGSTPPASALQPVSPARPLATAKKKMAIVDRLWTDKDGRQTTAKFVRMNAESVVLLRGVRTMSLPFDSLSPADQDYLRQLLRSRGDEDQIPVAPAPAEEAPLAQSPPGPAPPIPAPAETPAASDPPAASQQPGPIDLDGPKVGRGNSDFFDQYRQRDEETRQQHKEDAAAVAKAAADSGPQPSDAQPSAAQPPPAEAQPAEPEQPPLVTEEPQPTTSGSEGSIAGEATTRSGSGGGLRTTLDPEQIKDVRGAVTIVLVAVGVFGTLGMIVFIAIAIAGTSAARRERRYNA